MVYKDHVLTDKKVLITGATGGLGESLVKSFYGTCCHIYITGKDKKKLKKLKKKHLNIVDYLAGDFNNQEFVESIPNKFKDIDILINNAGIFELKGILNSKLCDYDNVFNVNVKAPFILSKLYSPGMVARGWGRIINICSSSSYGGSKDTGLYCASKHALLGLSRSMYLELKDKNVIVNAVSPGSIKTEMGEQDFRQDYDTFLNPMDISNFIVNVLLSNKSNMMIDEVRLNRQIIK